MYSSEDLKNLLNESYAVLSNDINKLQRLVSYYRQIYGVDSCLGCGGDGKYQEYYLKLKNEGLKIMETKEKTAFEFNKGVTAVPIEFGSNKYVTPTNLTDELALEFLAKNTNRISLFSKFPEDWKQQVEDYTSKKIKEETEEAVLVENPVNTVTENAESITTSTEETKTATETATTETKTNAKSAGKGK